MNVERREEGYEHASSKLKDVFDAMGLVLTEARTGPQRSMDVLSAERTVDDPSVPRPATGGLAGGTVGLRWVVAIVRPGFSGSAVLRRSVVDAEVPVGERQVRE